MINNVHFILQTRLAITINVGAMVSITSFRMIGPIVLVLLLLGNNDDDGEAVVITDGRTLDTVTSTSVFTIGMKVVGAAVAKVVGVGVTIGVVVVGLLLRLVIVGLLVPDDDGCNKEGSDDDLDSNEEDVGAILDVMIFTIIVGTKTCLQTQPYSCPFQQQQACYPARDQQPQR
jgi:hypothetical protein